jgi:hypothetical protein
VCVCVCVCVCVRERERERERVRQTDRQRQRERDREREFCGSLLLWPVHLPFYFYVVTALHFPLGISSSTSCGLCGVIYPGVLPPLSPSLPLTQRLALAITETPAFRESVQATLDLTYELANWGSLGECGLLSISQWLSILHFLCYYPFNILKGNS